MKAIRVRARIDVVADLSGPRRDPYRPNHAFGESDGEATFIGQVELPNGQQLEAGASGEHIVTFAWDERLEGLLKPGRTWQIREGQRLLAIAEVLQVI